jgi:hypothetical protein
MLFWVSSISRLSALLLMVILFWVGIRKGLPRWFMPYLGFLLSIASLIASYVLLPSNWLVFLSLSHAPEFLQVFVFHGLIYMGIIILIVLFIFFALLIPKYSPFYIRLRNDWTLVGFIIYGAAPSAILLIFDDYQNATIFILVAFFILAIGGWLYLRSEVPWKKFMYLFMGLALSMAVTAVGAAVLYESTPYFSTWQNLMLEVIYTWIWLAIFMLFPLAINLLPHANGPSPSLNKVELGN